MSHEFYNYNQNHNVSAWMHNCGLNVISHVFSIYLLKGDLDSALDRPVYKEILNVLNKTYGFENQEINYDKLKQILKSPFFENKQSIEILLSPVFRQLIKYAILNNPDALEGQKIYIGTLLDKYIDGLNFEDSEADIYKSAIDVFFKVKMDFLRVPDFSDARKSALINAECENILNKYLDKLCGFDNMLFTDDSNIQLLLMMMGIDADIFQKKELNLRNLTKVASNKPTLDNNIVRICFSELLPRVDIDKGSTLIINDGKQHLQAFVTDVNKELSYIELKFEGAEFSKIGAKILENHMMFNGEFISLNKCTSIESKQSDGLGIHINIMNSGSHWELELPKFENVKNYNHQISDDFEANNLVVILGNNISERRIEYIDDNAKLLNYSEKKELYFKAIKKILTFVVEHNEESVLREKEAFVIEFVDDITAQSKQIEERHNTKRKRDDTYVTDIDPDLVNLDEDMDSEEDSKSDEELITLENISSIPVMNLDEIEASVSRQDPCMNYIVTLANNVDFPNINCQELHLSLCAQLNLYTFRVTSKFDGVLIQVMKENKFLTLLKVDFIKENSEKIIKSTSTFFDGGLIVDIMINICKLYDVESKSFDISPEDSSIDMQKEWIDKNFSFEKISKLILHFTELVDEKQIIHQKSPAQSFDLFPDAMFQRYFPSQDSDKKKVIFSQSQKDEESMSDSLANYDLSLITVKIQTYEIFDRVDSSFNDDKTRLLIKLIKNRKQYECEVIYLNSNGSKYISISTNTSDEIANQTLIKSLVYSCFGFKENRVFDIGTQKDKKQQIKSHSAFEFGRKDNSPLNATNAEECRPKTSHSKKKPRIK